MLPARDRLTKLYVYSTEADMLADTNGTEFTSGVTDGSQHFQHIFFNSFPSFGETNAAMYECAISGTGDLTGKYIRVKYCYYATDAATTRTEDWLFAGKVYDCKYDKYKTERNLVAYDKMYELRSVDISAWWTTYWAAQTGNRTYAQLVVDMCTAFGVEYEWVNLSDAGKSIKKDAAQNLKLSGVTFTTMLGYVGQLSRYSWFIRANGKLGRTYMHNNITQTSVDSNMDASETEISDEALPAYTGVMVYDGADVIYSWGSGNPTWTIRDNPLLKGKTTSEITTEIDDLLPKLAVTAGYYPIELECMVSSPDVLNIGYDNLINIKTTDGNNVRKHVIGAIDLYGAQLINQHVTCPSEMQSGSGLTAAQAATISALQQLGVALTYKVNADNVIEAVNLEAQGGVQINAEAININGVVSANNGFKINLDGSMEATAGNIGGWSVTSDALTKTLNGSTVSLNAGNEYLEASISASDNDNNRVDIHAGNISTQHRLEGYSDVATGSMLLEGNNFEQVTEKWEAHAEWAAYEEIARAQLQSGKLTLESRDPNSYGYYVDQPWITSEISSKTLKIKGHDLLRLTPHLAQMFATNVQVNANLNSPAYCVVGQYYAGTDATVATLSNCPSTEAFNMTVCAPIQTTYDNESSAWVYRVRTIVNMSGEKWVQYCYTSGGGTWNYGGWRKVLTDNPSTYARTNITSATDANLSLTSNFGGNWYRKSGNVVEINLSVSGAVDSWRTVTTLPASYRPAVDRYFSALTLAYGVGAIYVSSTGLLRVRTASGSGTVGGCVTYIV